MIIIAQKIILIAHHQIFRVLNRSIIVYVRENSTIKIEASQGTKTNNKQVSLRRELRKKLKFWSIQLKNGKMDEKLAPSPSRTRNPSIIVRVKRASII